MDYKMQNLTHTVWGGRNRIKTSLLMSGLQNAMSEVGEKGKRISFWGVDYKMHCLRWEKQDERDLFLRIGLQNTMSEEGETG